MEISMIGFYNYSVIVTYIGVALSVYAMTLAHTGNFKYAILCLALAGACDTFDGKIARAMKNRTKEMEIFGVQIDSLCDMVCFGVTPAILSYHMGLNKPWGIAIEILFVLCGVIRLAYFNALEELKHTDPEKAKTKGYRGLPLTSITIIYPIVYLFRPLVSASVFVIILAIMHVVVAFLYVLYFKLKKPGNMLITAMMVLVAAVLACILFI